MQIKDMDKYIADVIHDNIHMLPDQLRLMYLNYCTGQLSVNDVCSVKANDYRIINSVPCIVISRDKADKIVPVSNDLYDAVSRYITSANLKADEYVFGNTHGRADAGYFCNQMRKYFLYCANLVANTHVN